MIDSLANWASIIGFFVSLIGITFAIWQINKTRRAAEAATEASNRTQKTISRNLLLSDVSICTKNLDDIKLFVQNKKYESAKLRVNDLISDLIQIQQRFENLEQIIQIDFKEILSQLSIIREELEKKVFKTSVKIDGVQINTELSKISDDLNKLIGGTKIAIEKGEENG